MNVTEHEMRGLLAGKCVPGDMLVNEELPAYLVRKFDAMQQKLDAVVAENAYIKSCVDGHAAGFSACPKCGYEESGESDDIVWMVKATPATDAILNAVRAEGAEAVAEYHKERFEFLKNTRRDASNDHKASYLCALDVANQLRAGNSEGATHD